jgi:hypothetical protein
MRTQNSALALGLFAILVGCAPLSQAGLVYSSRAQVGVNVAGGTPETPGFSANIGMNVNDSAYIPVVVGRPCELSNRAVCSQELVRVLGNNDIGDARSSEGDGDREVDNADGPPNDEAAPAGNGNSGVKSVQAAAPPAAPAAAAAAQARQAAQEAERAAARAEKVSSRSSNNRHDALSVYGTFDSNGAATGPGATPSGGANLRLGRIFSTGVASQNLTEGQRDALRADALTRCMAGAVSAAVEGTVREQLLTACAATVSARPRQ